MSSMISYVIIILVFYNDRQERENELTSLAYSVLNYKNIISI